MEIDLIKHILTLRHPKTIGLHSIREMEMKERILSLIFSATLIGHPKEIPENMG